MASDCTPDQPLRADATPEQVGARARWMYETGHTEAFGVGTQYAVARELAAARVASCHAEEIRREGLLHYALEGECPASPGVPDACPPGVCDCHSAQQDKTYDELCAEVKDRTARLAAAEAEVARLREVLRQIAGEEYPLCEAWCDNHPPKGEDLGLCGPCIARAALAEPRTEGVEKDKKPWLPGSTIYVRSADLPSGDGDTGEPRTEGAGNG